MRCATVVDGLQTGPAMVPTESSVTPTKTGAQRQRSNLVYAEPGGITRMPTQVNVSTVGSISAVPCIIVIVGIIDEHFAGSCYPRGKLELLSMRGHFAEGV
jgi:hypothetical protein